MPPALLNAEEITTQLSASLRMLGRLQGFSERTATLGECGVILNTCVARTKVAKPEAIDRRARQTVLRNRGLTSGQLVVSINSGVHGPAGRVWGLVGTLKEGASLSQNRHAWLLAGQVSDDAQRFTPTKFHLRPSLWSDVNYEVLGYAQEMQRQLPLARNSANLARQSWVQIADDLGLVLEDFPGPATSAAIAKARKAIASNGRTYQNGIGGERYDENKSYVASLINQLPYNGKIGLDAVLLGVLAGRAKYFEENVRREVFASHAATVKAYPWLKLIGTEE